MATVRLHGSSLESAVSAKAFIPATYYWRLRRTDGANNTNVTLLNTVTMKLAY